MKDENSSKKYFDVDTFFLIELIGYFFLATDMITDITKYL